MPPDRSKLYDNPRSPKRVDPYETQLSDKEEVEYQKWVAEKSAELGRPVESSDYDMRGFWKDPKARQGANGHFPDTYKKPSHPTFSNESKYSGVDGNEGGEWAKKGGKWTFQPGPTNISNGLDHTREYLKQSDPDVELIEPEEQPSAP